MSFVVVVVVVVQIIKLDVDLLYKVLLIPLV